jgi:mycothiol synthase
VIPREVDALTDEMASVVMEIFDAAGAADGVAPLSEATVLHVRHARTAVGPYADFIIGNGDGYAHLTLGEEPEGELVVHPRARRRGHGRALLDALAVKRAGAVGGGGAGVPVWAHGDLPAAAALARSAGWIRVRALWQLRRSLSDPLPDAPLPPGVTLRTFVVGKDEDAWLEVNGRAFAHHPEQGSWTAADLALREQEPWFDPDGFLLAERDGRIVGFHWTKIHPDPIGEVYVVGVDPGAQGGGLGRALTVAGLRYLRSRGLAEVMLYVDEDNQAGARTYFGLGFTRWSADVMYAQPSV